MNFFSFVFVSDTHGFLNDFEKQKEIIDKYNPEFVLAESLENIYLESDEDFKRVLKSQKISNMTSFSRVKDLIELCHKRDIKLIGMDLRNFGFNENLQIKIKNQLESSSEEQEEIDKIIIERERKHAEILKKYKDKSTKPVIVIIGSWHLRENSPILKGLNNYKMIFPCDGKGNMIFGPTNEKIFWCER